MMQFVYLNSGYNNYISNSSELSLHIVGGYGILAIPNKSTRQSWQSGYGRDAIPSYRLPLIYKDKYELILMPVPEDENDFRASSLPVYTVKELFDTISLF